MPKDANKIKVPKVEITADVAEKILIHTLLQSLKPKEQAWGFIWQNNRRKYRRWR
jgi:hypothetical protein